MKIKHSLTVQLNICYYKAYIWFKKSFFFRHPVILPKIAGSLFSDEVDDGIELHDVIFRWFEEYNLTDKDIFFIHKKYISCTTLYHRFEFYFKRKEDAVFFKMRWLDE